MCNGKCKCVKQIRTKVSTRKLKDGFIIPLFFGEDNNIHEVYEPMMYSEFLSQQVHDNRWIDKGYTYIDKKLISKAWATLIADELRDESNEVKITI